MKYLLDTNTCVVYLRGTHPATKARIAAEPPGSVVLCSMVKAELIFGALRSSRPAENLQTLDVFFSGFASLPFDDAAAEDYGSIRATLTKAGTPIGPNDLVIAAIALSKSLTLVTHNVAEFRRVPGLQVEDWQASP
ncbi:MAG TPA: type II toxin-antitoxin system VapC family toxin [Tepidisphaeraceae bacterium]|nr:type II toxin-antitoxin system VapC family toxin [Tepidisphaeraceae bacterium]